MFLLDTNVLIHYLNNSLPKNSIAFLNSFIDENCYISAITKIEILGYNYKKIEERNIVESLIENSIVFMINNEIINKTIAIRKSRKIDLPDAIIAATAITNDFTLITNNTKDFNKIQGIKMLNSFELKTI